VPVWILLAVPSALSAAVTGSFLAALAAQAAARARLNGLTLGLLSLLIGSLVFSVGLLGGRHPLLQAGFKRWIEPWGYYGYVPLALAAAPFVLAGLYLVKKYAY
jgi:hypothetical protein